MKLIRFAFISLIVFALLITGISLLFPSHIRISKATDINAEKDSVLVMLNNPVNWKKWYPGADTADYFLSNGKITGIRSGHLKVLVIKEANDSSVLAVYDAPGSKRAESGWNLFFGSSPHTVTIQWYMDFHLRWYPWEKFSSLLLEKRYGPVMEQGLANLKMLLNK
jgi:hypothetical protein